MGEAKRRAAAPPHATTSAAQVLRKLNEAAARLPPAPMNGATSLDLSPGDYAKVRERLKPSLTGASTFFGLSVRCDPMLVDGLFIGRRDGKPVWSNQPWMQEAIDARAAGPAPGGDGR